MAKGIYIQNQHVKGEDELLCDLCKAARKYQKYADHNLLFIYSGSRQEKPCWYEVHYGAENFMHLTGFKIREDSRKYYSARDFFTFCCEDSLKITGLRNHFDFTESRKETSGKIDALLRLFDYQYVKLYKIGKRGATTSLNQFSIAIGNREAILGFDDRGHFLPIPVTAMKRALSDYVFVQKKVIAILMKNDSRDKYSDVIGCVASGIERESLPDEIKQKISEEVAVLQKKQ